MEKTIYGDSQANILKGELLKCYGDNIHGKKKL